MSRVLTFSRFFPAYHPKAGQPTYFVEKIMRGLYMLTPEAKEIMDMEVWANCDPLQKHHTICAGNRWKVGDKFSPRVWSGKPYASPQITFAPDIELLKVWDFEIKMFRFEAFCAPCAYINNRVLVGDDYLKLAQNDGLTNEEMVDWFTPPNKKFKPFGGQILCWNKEIDY